MRGHHWPALISSLSYAQALFSAVGCVQFMMSLEGSPHDCQLVHVAWHRKIRGVLACPLTHTTGICMFAHVHMTSGVWIGGE